MPPNVSTPGSAGTPDPQIDISAELERAQKEMYDRLLGDISALSTKQHEKIVSLLGKKAPKTVVDKGYNWWQKRVMKVKGIDLSLDKADIVRVLVEQKAAMAALMPDVLNPADETLEVGTTSPEKLANLLIDPTSAEARILHALYTQYDGKSNPEWRAILKPSPLSSDDVIALKAIDELRTEYAAVAQDATLHNLDNKKANLARERAELAAQNASVTTTTPPPTTVSAPIININSAGQAGGVDIQKNNARIREIDTELGGLDGKLLELEQRMRNVDKKGFAIANPGTPYSPTHFDTVLKPDLGKFVQYTSVPFTWNASTVAVDTTSHTMEDWLKGSEAPGEISVLKVRAKRGDAKISASAAIDEMLKAHYREKERGASDAEIAALVGKMRALLAQSGAAAPSVADAEAATAAAAPSAPKKFWGSTWLHTLGGNSLRNWWWNLDKDGKEKPPVEKKESSGSMWGSFKKYMSDDSKNFLGFDVPKKKS